MSTGREPHDERPKQGVQDAAAPECSAARRSVLAWLIAGGSAVFAAVLGIPAALAFGTPIWHGRHGHAWRRVGPVGEFAVDSVQTARVPVNRNDWAQSLDELAVFVWRQSESDFVVYSRNCTDLSCPVHFDAGSECFLCPCHGGIFNKQGFPLAGPPPRPLYRYAHRVRSGVIEIDLYSVPLTA